MAIMEPEPKVGREDLIWKAKGMVLRGVLILALVAAVVVIALLGGD